MNQQIRDAISKILARTDRPNRFDPGYEYWIAGQVWEAATLAERARCAAVSGPKCAEAIFGAGGLKMEMKIEKLSGKKGVIIRDDKYGIEVLTMRNGYQWSGMPMDDELIDMLEAAISEFKARRNA